MPEALTRDPRDPEANRDAEAEAPDDNPKKRDRGTDEMEDGEPEQRR